MVDAFHRCADELSALIDKQVPRRRLRLVSGMVGDWDGVYDHVRAEDYDKPENSPGYYPSESGWSEDAYTIVEILPPPPVTKEQPK